MGENKDHIAVLFKFADFDGITGKEYTAIVACVGYAGHDSFEMESWDGIDFKHRAQAPELLENVLKDFKDLDGLIVDPMLAPSVSMKKIRPQLKAIEYDEEKYGDLYGSLLSWFL